MFDVNFVDRVWMFWLDGCVLQLVDLVYFDLKLHMMDFSVSVKKNYLRGLSVR